jgi:hypothetical protein
MEIGRRLSEQATFLDDVDRAYIVAQLEGAMDEPVDLEVAARSVSRLLLPGMAAGPPSGADEARRAGQLGRELAALVPKVRVTVVEGDDDLPTFTVGGRGVSRIRFLGIPRVNLFRALLDAIRRASTHDHGFDQARARDLRQLPADVHAAVFATPT